MVKGPLSFPREQCIHVLPASYDRNGRMLSSAYRSFLLFVISKHLIMNKSYRLLKCKDKLAVFLFLLQWCIRKIWCFYFWVWLISFAFMSHRFMNMQVRLFCSASLFVTFYLLGVWRVLDICIGWSMQTKCFLYRLCCRTFCFISYHSNLFLC